MDIYIIFCWTLWENLVFAAQYTAHPSPGTDQRDLRSTTVLSKRNVMFLSNVVLWICYCFLYRSYLVDWEVDAFLRKCLAPVHTGPKFSDANPMTQLHLSLQHNPFAQATPRQQKCPFSIFLYVPAKNLSEMNAQEGKYLRFSAGHAITPPGSLKKAITISTMRQGESSGKIRSAKKGKRFHGPFPILEIAGVVPDWQQERWRKVNDHHLHTEYSMLWLSLTYISIRFCLPIGLFALPIGIAYLLAVYLCNCRPSEYLFAYLPLPLLLFIYRIYTCIVFEPIVFIYSSSATWRGLLNAAPATDSTNLISKCCAGGNPRNWPLGYFWLLLAPL